VLASPGRRATKAHVVRALGIRSSQYVILSDVEGDSGRARQIQGLTGTGRRDEAARQLLASWQADELGPEDLRCAVALRDAARNHGFTRRAGIHTGEIETRPSDVAGIAVHMASRIAALAGPSEILVSRTVVDLTGGSGLQFDRRGEHRLKGVPGVWPTFAVHTDVPIQAT
jgi:class 3 adenylate cyclase